MLEALVFNFGALDPVSLTSLLSVVILLGALGAALVLPAPAVPLGRARFFFLSGLALFLVSAGQFLWLLYLPLLKLGVSFLLLASEVLILLAYGAFSAQIARARSLDAYGNGRRAWMAFVPLCNLWLLFKPPSEPRPVGGEFAAVLTGLLLFALGRMVAMQAEASGEDLPRQIQADADAAAIVLALQIRVRGIEAALDDLVAAEAAPQQLSPNLQLFSVVRQGTAILYEFRIDEAGVTSLDPDVRRQMQADFCGAMMSYLQAGATAQLQFRRSDRLKLDVLDLSVKDCTT